MFWWKWLDDYDVWWEKTDPIRKLMMLVLICLGVIGFIWIRCIIRNECKGRSFKDCCWRCWR